eukprot:359629-Chlamydomonas_euryale.AAC.3
MLGRRDGQEAEGLPRAWLDAASPERADRLDGFCKHGAAQQQAHHEDGRQQAILKVREAEGALDAAAVWVLVGPRRPVHAVAGDQAFDT